ncbi:hypothetical protein NO1_2150, partial [Candidatus Termititenax aidoneus]
MSKATVQNIETKLEGISLEAVDKSVVELTTAIFDCVIKSEGWQNILDDFGKTLIAHADNPLLNGSMFTDKQKDAIEHSLPAVLESVKAKYIASVKTDERSQKIADLISHNVRKIAEKVLASIGAEINRGAIINCWAVAADAKNEDFDQITLRKSKEAGDITIPTQCILFST